MWPSKVHMRVIDKTLQDGVGSMAGRKVYT